MPTPHVRTVADLLHAYEEDHLPLKALSTQQQQRSVFRWLRQEFGPLPLTELTPQKLKDWRDAMRRRQLAPGTIRQYMITLSAALTAAVDEYEWLAVHPMKKVRKPPMSPGRVRYLSREERERLLVACAESKNPYLYVIVLMALTTGLRLNEVRQLRWQDLDLQTGALRLPPTKNGERRGLPIPEMLLEPLRHFEHQTGWLFPSADGKRPIVFRIAWAQACKRAGVDNFHFHDLRHTAASYLAMSGASLLDIATILGHKNVQMTKRYAHLMPGHTKGVIERMIHQFIKPPDPPQAE